MDPSYLKYRFKKSLLTCYSVVLLPENVMFAFFFVKNVKKCPCVTYIRYIYLYTHAYTLCADLTFYLFVARKPPSLAISIATASPSKTTLNHAPKVWWSPYQKPYHTNLCTPTMYSYSHASKYCFLASTVFHFSLKIEVIVIHKALFLLIFLTIFTHFRNHYCHVPSLGFLWCKHRARRSQTSLFSFEENKHICEMRVCS